MAEQHKAVNSESLLPKMKDHTTEESETPATPFPFKLFTTPMKPSAPRSKRPRSSAQESGQPSSSELQSLGIKVRDFAYESTLAPVRTIYRLPPQVQPDPWSNEGSSGNNYDRHISKKKKLERVPTEPAIETAAAITRAQGFLSFGDHEKESHPQLPSSQKTNESQSPIPYIESQERNHNDTPLATPSGSLNWAVTNTSDLPASQLDTESQATAPEIFSYSQLAFSQTSDATELYSSPPIEPSYPLPSQFDSPTSIRSSPAQRRLDDPSSPTRHQLRKRSAKPISPRISPRQSSRAYNLRSYSSPLVPSRPSRAAMQSAHSQSKTKGPAGSPSSRILRKPPSPITPR